MAVTVVANCGKGTRSLAEIGLTAIKEPKKIWSPDRMRFDDVIFFPSFIAVTRISLSFDRAQEEPNRWISDRVRAIASLQLNGQSAGLTRSLDVHK